MRPERRTHRARHAAGIQTESRRVCSLESARDLRPAASDADYGVPNPHVIAADASPALGSAVGTRRGTGRHVAAPVLDCSFRRIMYATEDEEYAFCAACNRDVSRADQVYPFGKDALLCFDCAVARHGIYEELLGRWTLAPRLDDLPDAPSRDPATAGASSPRQAGSLEARPATPARVASAVRPYSSTSSLQQKTASLPSAIGTLMALSGVLWRRVSRRSTHRTRQVSG
jgi:hypothetical protein